MFNKDQFIEDCKNALTQSQPQSAIKEILEKAVSHPAEIIRNLGEPQSAGIETIYHAPDLTILNFLWGPNMFLYPHNHEMWANIGMYGGQEVNRFYIRNQPTGLNDKNTRVLEGGDVITLGRDVIHSVENPLPRISAGLHVYGGDFFNTPRREWDPDTQEEGAFNFERAKQIFAESNVRYQKMKGQNGKNGRQN